MSIRFGLEPLSERASLKVGIKSLFGLKPLTPAAVEEEVKTCELLGLDIAAAQQSYFGGEPWGQPVEFGQRSKQGKLCDGTWQLISAGATMEKIGTPDPVSSVTIHTPFSPFNTTYDFGITIQSYGGTFHLGFISTAEAITVYGASWYTYYAPETLTVTYVLKSPAGKEFNCSIVIPFV